jgi:hypothetical protein
MRAVIWVRVVGGRAALVGGVMSRGGVWMVMSIAVIAVVVSGRGSVLSR